MYDTPSIGKKKQHTPHIIPSKFHVWCIFSITNKSSSDHHHRRRHRNSLAFPPTRSPRVLAAIECCWCVFPTTHLRHRRPSLACLPSPVVDATTIAATGQRERDPPPPQQSIENWKEREMRDGREMPPPPQQSSILRVGERGMRDIVATQQSTFWEYGRARRARREERENNTMN